MNQELLERLETVWPELEPGVRKKIARYHELLADENERQNLTRLISPKDFVEGHVLDVKALLEANLIDFPAMDLGSGCGVPGLLAAIVKDDRWVLAESERHKAEFLFRVARELGLHSVRVVADRGESFLSENPIHTVVARAVGPIERIYGWLQSCSTWNAMVLLKGPAWKTEWESFQRTRWKGELHIEKVVEYTVGEEQKKRILVRLERVPRGT